MGVVVLFGGVLAALLLVGAAGLVDRGSRKLAQIPIEDETHQQKE